MKPKTFAHPDACPYCHSERLAVDGTDCAFRCYTRISFAQRKPHAKRTLKCIAIATAETRRAEQDAPGRFDTATQIFRKFKTA